MFLNSSFQQATSFANVLFVALINTQLIFEKTACQNMVAMATSKFLTNDMAFQIVHS